MTNTKSLIEQVKEEKEKLKSKCTFKKGDILEWTNAKGKVIRGVFKYYSVSDDLTSVISIDLPVYSHINWSSSCEYIKEPDLSKFKVIDNPCSVKKLERIEDMIDEDNYEMAKKVKILKHQKERLQNIKYSEQDKCIHNWEKVTGNKIRTEKGGMWSSDKEIYEWYCTFCGMEIESC